MIRFEIPDGSAELGETDGERVVLRASRASPPGSTLEARLEGTTYSVKVRGCRRDGDSFVIDGRWVNLSRAMRARVLGES